MSEADFEHAAHMAERERAAAIARIRDEAIGDRLTACTDCIGCGEPIPPARLAARPLALRCVDCQVGYERRTGA